MGDIHVVYHLLIKVECFLYNYMSCTLKLMPFRSYVRSTPRTKENRATYRIVIFPILAIFHVCRDKSRFFQHFPLNLKTKFAYIPLNLRAKYHVFYKYISHPQPFERRYGIQKTEKIFRLIILT